MSNQFIDDDTILSNNEQWTKLDQLWGTPVDLDTEISIEHCNSAFSICSKCKANISVVDDRKHSTFDSSSYLRKMRKTKENKSPKKNTGLDYSDFIKDLNHSTISEEPSKPFYYINGEIMSADTVKKICGKIDEIFNTLEKLYSATSTIKKTETKSTSEMMKKSKNLPEVVEWSADISGLSFDDTQPEKTDRDVDKCIEEIFDEFDKVKTVAVTNIHTSEIEADDVTKETVTTLVKRFSNILKNPRIKCNPRRQRNHCERFKELAEFWRTKASASV